MRSENCPARYYTQMTPVYYSCTQFQTEGILTEMLKCLAVLNSGGRCPVAHKLRMTYNIIE